MIEEVKNLENKVIHPIEKSLLEKDLIIVLEADRLSQNLIRHHCAFKLTIDQENGSIRIVDLHSEFISQAYVKVFYMNKEKEIMFLKDGFTDCEGSFVYS